MARTDVSFSPLITPRLSRACLAAFCVALGLVALPSPVLAAGKPGTFAGSLGVKVPKGGHAELRAINRATGGIAAIRTVGRTGRFSLTVPAGAYLMVGTVVTRQRKVVQKRIAVSLKPGQKRRRAKLTAPKRKRKRGARAAFVQELGQITPGRVAVEIPNVTGTTGDPEWDAFRGGINDLLIHDVLQASGGCGTTLIEVEYRAEALRELEFQQSPYVDPSTRLTRNLIIGDVELRGTIAAAPGGDATVSMTIVEIATGNSLGTRETTVSRSRDVFAPLETLGKQLAEDICKLSDVYKVTLDVSGVGRFATHSATGFIRETLQARRNGTRVWTATGPLSWTGATFTSNIECPYIDYLVPTTNWAVTITDAGDGQLKVEWTRTGNESTTASVDCPSDGENDPPPIPGQPGVSLINTGPNSFLVPYAGGTQAVSGVVESGGDGFFNSGTMTVERGGIG